MHYLLWCCVQSMIAVYVKNKIKSNNNNNNNNMAARGSRISSPVLSLQRSICALQVLCLCQRPKAHRPCTSCLPLKHVGGCQNVAADSLVATDLQFDHTVSINLTTASTIISIIIFVSAAAIHAVYIELLPST